MDNMRSTTYPVFGALGVYNRTLHHHGPGAPAVLGTPGLGGMPVVPTNTVCAQASG